MYVCIYAHIYTCIERERDRYVLICVYMYICIETEREREMYMSFLGLNMHSHELKAWESDPSFRRERELRDLPHAWCIKMSVYTWLVSNWAHFKLGSFLIGLHSNCTPS